MKVFSTLTVTYHFLLSVPFMPFLFLKNTSRPRTDMITHLGPMLNFPYMKLIKKALRVWREKLVMCITWELAELSRLSGDFINNLNCFLWYPSWPSQIKNKNSSLWEKKKKKKKKPEVTISNLKVSAQQRKQLNEKTAYTLGENLQTMNSR